MTLSLVLILSIHGNIINSDIEINAASDNYFKVKENHSTNVTVYDNSSGSLKPVGWLHKGEVYEYVKSYSSNFWEIKFNGKKAYVYKPATEVVNDGDSEKNWTSQDILHEKAGVAESHLTIYESDDGSLIPMARLYKGEKFNFIQQKWGDWLEVQVGGRTGYVYAPAVRLAFESSDEYFKVKQDNVTVYDNSSGSLQPVGWLDEGQTFKRTDDWGNWHQIRFNGDFAYVWENATAPIRSGYESINWITHTKHNYQGVAEDHLTIYDNSSGALEPMSRLYKGQPFKYIELKWGSWLEVQVGNRTGYVYAPAVNRDFTPKDQYFEVSSNFVTVYNRTDSSREPLGQLYKGNSYKKTSSNGGWHEIQFGGEKGYIWGRNSTKPSYKSNVTSLNTSGKIGDEGITTLEDVIVYQKPNETSSSIGKINRGVSYKAITKENADWYKVDLSGRYGYVQSSLVEIDVSYTQYDITYEEFLNRQMNASTPPQTDKYRNAPAYIKAENVETSSQAAISEDGTRVRTDPNDTSSESVYKTVSKDTTITILESNVQGFEYEGSTNWYKIAFDDFDGDLYVHENLVYTNNKTTRIVASEGVTVGDSNLRTAPNLSDEYKEVTVSKGTKLEYLKTVKGDSFEGVDKWYEVKYNNKTLYIHSTLLSLATVNVFADKSTDSHIYGTTSHGANWTIVNQGTNWYQIAYKTWRNAPRSDVDANANPENQGTYQHLLLSESVNVSANQLNNILVGKGVLEGQGQAFIDAGNNYGVNEIYLISHAILETGHGTSQLATGIEVGKKSNGSLTLVTSSNRSSLSNIKTVYNMYGIGAFDNTAVESGAYQAYRLGWTSVETAIIEGAEWIGDRYINNSNQQNTLYKMRWNPSNPATHQYATDIQWASKQIPSIKQYYDMLDNPHMKLDIPKFK